MITEARIERLVAKGVVAVILRDENGDVYERKTGADGIALYHAKRRCWDMWTAWPDNWQELE